MCQTDKSRQISQYGNDCQRNNQDQHRVEECAIGKYTAEQSSQTGQHHSLRALHNTDFTFQSQTFGTCAYLTYHQRTDQSKKSDNGTHEIALQDEIIGYAEQGKQFTVTIEH